MRWPATRGAARAVALAAVLMLATLVLTACGDDAFESNDFYMMFLTSQPPAKQVANSSGRGAPTMEQLRREKEVYTVHGILQAEKAVEEIAEADGYRDEAAAAAEKGDYDRAALLLDEAIEIRENDPLYRRERAEVALAEGDVAMAKGQWAEQDRSAGFNKWTDRAWYWDEMTTEADAIVAKGTSGSIPDETGEVASAAYTRASELYAGAAEFATSQGDAELAQQYEETAETYRSKAGGGE